MSKIHKGENHHYYGKKRSEEVKKQISKTLTGSRHSIETREKMSLSKIGKKNSMFGKKHKKEAIDKMKKPKSEEHKQKLRKPKPKYKCNFCNKLIGGYGNLKQHVRKCRLIYI